MAEQVSIEPGQVIPSSMDMSLSTMADAVAGRNATNGGLSLNADAIMFYLDGFAAPAEIENPAERFVAHLHAGAEDWMVEESAYELLAPFAEKVDPTYLDDDFLSQAETLEAAGLLSEMYLSALDNKGSCAAAVAVGFTAETLYPEQVDLEPIGKATAEQYAAIIRKCLEEPDTSFAPFDALLAGAYEARAAATLAPLTERVKELRAEGGGVVR